ncbi:hypothetical protein LguiA_006834 [Lonicera macranthoides]
MLQIWVLWFLMLNEIFPRRFVGERELRVRGVSAWCLKDLGRRRWRFRNRGERDGGREENAEKGKQGYYIFVI